MRAAERATHGRARAPAAHALGDLRFRALLSDEDWAALPAAVRARFSHRLSDGATIVYAGRVTAMERSGLGAVLAHALRPIGAPLPLWREEGGASVISVTEDGAGGGQVWTRLYARPSGFPQIIHSAKRFGGPTGLEEHIGGGLSIALRVGVEAGALVFRSEGYRWRLLGRCVALPRILSPGKLTVRHEDRGDGTFLFELTLDHPLFGRLLRQAGIYRDVET